MTLIEDSSPVWEVFVDKFDKDFVVVFDSFCIEDLLDSFVEGCCNCGFLLSSNSELHNGATGMEGFDDFVFEVASEDESAVATKHLSKRP